MRFWLSRRTSIPVKEQLSAQFLLAILSGTLEAGEKLPSVRALARQLHIHSNTVSAVYRDLAARGWVSARAGSGVFVQSPGFRRPGQPLDEFVHRWVLEGAAQGYSLAGLQAALARFASSPKPRSFIVADPDEDFARVLAAEIAEGIGSPVGFTSLDALLSGSDNLDTPCVLINAAHLAKLPDNIPHTVIRLKSMQDVLAGQVRPSHPVLIAVVSRSGEIHHWSSKLLAALGFPPDAVIQRNPSTGNWQDGLAACDIVAADLLACAELPPGIHPIQFRLVADDFISELRAACGITLP
jgi:DNA-binding transcriptional regulator YhcF (GntR family)